MTSADVRRLLARVPLVDGHNDLPHVIRERAGGDVSTYGLGGPTSGHTDLRRLRAGGVGAQFWVAYVPCEHAGTATEPPAGATRYALEQLDVVAAMHRLHDDVLAPAWSATELEVAFARGRIASLIGVEGGHAIEDSLPTLRAFRRLGARYLTLTHNCTLRWADSATDEDVHGGLTAFGREVVRELNRLGMMVDLSHTSPDVMRDALDVSEAPVVFTHSSARAVTDHPRNVPDDVLEKLRHAGGIVMATFVPKFVSESVRTWEGPEEEAPPATIADVAEHLDHLKAVAGPEHVGLGGDYDGTPFLPQGLEDVSCYPILLEELASRGWTEAELEGLVGRNVLRVMRRVEGVGEAIRAMRPPSRATIEELDGTDAPGGVGYGPSNHATEEAP